MIAETHLERIEKLFFFREQNVGLARNTINEIRVCLKKILGVRRCYVYVARLIVDMTTNQTR